MTRINCAIPVKFLTDEHLLAEHRELERMPWYHEMSLKSGSISKVPSKFTLGKGHVLFFVNKMGFVLNRYKEVHLECLRRNFSVIDRSYKWDNIDKKYMNDYSPTKDDYNLLVERLSERIKDSKKVNFRYFGNNINKNEAIKLLKWKI